MHEGSFFLRQATVQDAAALSAFAQRVFVETFGKDNTPEDMEAYVRTTFSAELQAREIAEAGSFMLLASVSAPDAASDGSGVLAGYSHVMRTEVPAEVGDPGLAALEIRRFYVGKEWQGVGLAGQLMRETLRQAEARGARTVWLGVWEHNPRAIAFYRKQGFEVVGSHPFMVGSDLQTDLLMAVSLDPAAR
jgi:ribosomal protein S18 acetylase RimI-like enzyme